MDSFRERFVGEALDLLSKLEKALLMLEVKPDNTLITEEIFRGLHTLKGSSAMYGFEKVGHLMHLVENVFDKIRDKQIKVDNKIINLSLEVVDFTNKILKLNDDVSPSAIHGYNKLAEQIEQIVGIDKKAITDNEIKTKEKNSDSQHTYFIKFTIDIDFEKRGINIESMFKELEGMGSLILIPLEEIGENNGSWEIFVVSKASYIDIEDVFIFLMDIVHIEKLADENLFLNSAFKLTVQKNAALKKPNDLNELKKIATQKKREESKLTYLPAEPVPQLGTNFLKVAAEKLDEQMDLLSELVTAKAELRLIVENEKYRKLFKLVESIDKITNRFRKNILNARLVQVKTWYVMFLRLVRDISKQLNKNVAFVAEGLDTELDKNIIDSLESPLTHLIRNSLDHGIETPEERIKLGKPEKGTIKLKAYHSGSEIAIEIIDDGRGIDKEKIRQKAVSKGIFEADVILTDKQIYDLIFLPGFSTAQNLTEVSGRGVGMDVVKKAITQLRGEIDIKSTEGVGTNILIKLPMLLSIMDTLLIRSGEQYFAIPLPEVYKCTQLKSQELELSDNNQLNIEGELIPYINLREVFHINGTLPEKQKLVVIFNSGKHVALTTDEVIGEYQAVLKPFDGYFINNQYFTGASLLADGHMCVIIDTARLLSDKLNKTI
jgi:two-component system, chemotaxis family, sensor kinase CheA